MTDEPTCPADTMPLSAVPKVIARQEGAAGPGWHDFSSQDVGSRPLRIASKRLSLVIASRLLRDCIEEVLQRPDRIIRGHCQTIAELHDSFVGLMAPDLVIVRLGGDEEATSFAAIRQMRLRWPETKWIVLSRRVDFSFVREAVTSGVDGLFLEDSPLEVLRLLTDLILLGHSLLPKGLARLLTNDAAACEISAPEFTDDGFSSPGFRSPERHEAKLYDPGFKQASQAERATTRLDDAPFSCAAAPRRLSDRELEILRCVSQGQSNKLIARQLDIAETTVKAHVKALLRKMQVSNRTQAAINAPSFLNGADRRHAAMLPVRQPAVDDIRAPEPDHDRDPRQILIQSPQRWREGCLSGGNSTGSGEGGLARSSS